MPQWFTPIYILSPSAVSSVRNNYQFCIANQDIDFFALFFKSVSEQSNLAFAGQIKSKINNFGFFIPGFYMIEYSRNDNLNEILFLYFRILLI